MRQRFTRFVHPLRLPFLLAILVIVAMTSLPVDSRAAGTCPRIWDYTYYYDDDYTQWAGSCSGSCYPGGAYCVGEQTEYYVRYGGELCDCGSQG
jgi:hypothetical protein